MNGTANLTPGGKPHQQPRRRRFKIDCLPPRAQALVFRGFAGGDTLRKIQGDLKKMGHSVGHSTLSRYWLNVWTAEHDRLRYARASLAALKQALRVEPDSPSGQLAEELLYTIVFQKLPEMEQQQVLTLLHEAREQQKLNAPRSSPKPAGSSPVRQARQIRRRWRKLYGLESPDDSSDQNTEDN